MKTRKRVFALLAAMVMVFGLSTTVFAEGPSYTITVESGVDGQTYTAYKVFDVTIADTSNPADGTYDAFAYTINSSTNKFWDVLTNGITPADGVYTTAYGLTLTPTTTSNVYNVTGTPTQAQIQALAAALNQDTTKPAAAGSITSYSSSNKTITVSELGYYFLDSSMGSLCSLDTTATNVTIYEKNATPTLAKQVQEDATTITVGTKTSTANAYGDIASADIGQTVNFKLTVNTGADTEYWKQTDDTANLGTGVSNTFVITDVLPGGMSFNGDIFGTSDSQKTDGTKSAESFSITDAGNNTWALGTDFFVSYSGDTITLTLAQSALARLGINKDITISYGTTVDEDAVIGGNGNTNTASLKYTGDSVDYTTTDVSTTVYVSAAALYKFNTAAAELANAQFTVTTPENAAMYFTQVSEGSASSPAVYRYNSSFTSSTSDATDTIITPESGAVVIYGLDTGAYTFTETEAPSGYNKLTASPTVTVSYASAALSSDISWSKTTTGYESMTGTATFVHGTDDTASSVTYKIAASSVLGVLNQSGVELPSTGGMGTRLFYIIGAILVVGAGIILVARRRKNDK